MLFAVHHLDTPWVLSALEQREGRVIRKGNEVAKLYAGNKVDAVFYAVEKSCMNFSEYVAILSDNTELLEKARLEKKVVGLESERQAFMRGKSSSRYKLEDILQKVEKFNGLINRITGDMETFKSAVQYDSDKNALNPVQLDSVADSNSQIIGETSSLHRVKSKAKRKRVTKIERISLMISVNAYAKMINSLCSLW